MLLLCFAHYIFHLASLEDKNTSVEIYSSCRSFRTVCSAAHRPDIGSSASFLAKNFLSSTNYKVLLSTFVKNILSRIFTRSSWKRSSNIISLYTRGVNPSEGLFDSIKSLVIALASFMKSFRFPPSLQESFFLFFSFFFLFLQWGNWRSNVCYVCFKTFRIVGELRLFVSESTRETFCLIVCSEYRDLCLLECCFASWFQVARNDFPLKFLSFSPRTWRINANSGPDLVAYLLMKKNHESILSSQDF